MKSKREINEERLKELTEMYADPSRANEFMASLRVGMGPIFPKMISERLVGIDEVCKCGECGQINVHLGNKGVWLWEPCGCGVIHEGIGAVDGELLVSDEQSVGVDEG